MPSKVFTLQDVEELRDVQPKRRRLADYPVVSKRTDGRYIASTKFPSIDRLFEEETGITTIMGPYGPYCYLNEDEFRKAKDWQDNISSLVFLRDMLDCSVALDFNLEIAGVYTDIGFAEHNAKVNRDKGAIKALVRACRSAIDKISLYSACDCVCAVPPSPDKEWDLPTEIVAQLCNHYGKKDVSAKVSFTRAKKSVKTLSLSQKWAALEDAGLCVRCSVEGARIILLDDKYQSGTTAQFVASKLYAAGAEEICGLFCIKTWRDTDNM